MNKNPVSVIRGCCIETKYRIIPVIEATGDFTGAYVKKNTNTIGAVMIDLVDACNLRCPCCPRGTRKMPNNNKKISLDKFRKVIEKLSSLGVYALDFFNWSEPFLVSNLHEYISQCEQFLIKVNLSTNLSLPKIDNLRTVFESQNLSKVFVSVSGFNAETHAIYHRGSDIDVVKSNLLEIVKLNLPDLSFIHIKYLDFGYNSSEVKQMQNFANEWGFGFTHDRGCGNPEIVPKGYTEKPTKCELLPPPPVRTVSQKLHCFLSNSLALDYNADAYLCCCWPNLPNNRLGNLLEDSLQDIFARRYSHPRCETCDIPKDMLIPFFEE
jgi:MoaA/NifB/PqqE/SkfB family radical SAM enzyme